jgi:hypothetical protein
LDHPSKSLPEFEFDPRISDGHIGVAKVALEGTIDKGEKRIAAEDAAWAAPALLPCMTVCVLGQTSLPNRT